MPPKIDMSSQNLYKTNDLVSRQGLQGEISIPVCNNFPEAESLIL